MEEKIKKMRNELEETLRNKKITFYEWKRIESYIDDRYEKIQNESTL